MDKNFHLHLMTLEPVRVEQAVVSQSLENHSYLHANLETSALAYFVGKFHNIDQLCQYF
jgi:hypothetical protein